MKANSILIIRLILLLALVGFVAGFAASQYELVRSLVTVLCLSCIGIR
jgi:cell division protein FtsB